MTGRKRESIARTGQFAPLLALVLSLAFGVLSPGAGSAEGNGGTAATAPAQAPAGDAVPAGSLAELIHTEALFAIVADEGTGYGREIGKALFPEGAAPGWEVAVSRIYDATLLRRRFEQALDVALADQHAARDAAIAFFASPAGQRITTAELAARRALLDEATAEAAAVAAERLRETGDPRLRRLRRLMAAGNLVDENTAAALSGLLAFELGLQDAADPSARIPEDQLAREVMSREGGVRAETADWLAAFMALAYADLDDADLDAYADFAESPAGRTLNAALFSAYAAALTPALRDLGHEAGLILRGKPI